MTFYEIISYFILGINIGIFGGMLGIGGGLIAIPIFNTFFHMEQHILQGTTLTIIAPNVFIGFLIYKRHNYIDLKKTFTLCLFSTISSWISAKIVTTIPVHSLQKTSAIFLFLLSIYYIFQWINDHKKIVKKNIKMLSFKFLPLLGIISGIMSGILTIGGGLIIVPALVTLFGFNQTQAQGIALASVTPSALVALLIYAQNDSVDWNIGLPLAIGSTVGIIWGVELAHILPTKWLKCIFFSVLIIIAITII
ncbi:Sulfite exporter TauE/SafE family protein [Candidatus Westeberhardia cardiocondylae]|uniref:Probable membrane transporter protein n=1 Tax=Candidatus Westeberhardia cardiocondylae TaxID=1594731 RepID=A0A0H5BWN0_9ENTR|nr:sulfite exporter TauE/SafE family protein [Candidatus Westeberhardia cardiocondylae]CEN32117.1 Sulfite exporter TauE/SafE family protein [Candidatus Westeberhardia cardiocondylae]